MTDVKISKTVAPKCPEFEPVQYVTVRDLHNMLLMKKEMDGGMKE